MPYLVKMWPVHPLSHMLAHIATCIPKVHARICTHTHTHTEYMYTHVHPSAYASHQMEKWLTCQPQFLKSMKVQALSNVITSRLLSDTRCHRLNAIHHPLVPLLNLKNQLLHKPASRSASYSSVTRVICWNSTVANCYNYDIVCSHFVWNAVTPSLAISPMGLPKPAPFSQTIFFVVHLCHNVCN